MIKQTPSLPSSAQATFSTLPLGSSMLANLDKLDYRVMTPIQAAALPAALAGQDLIAQAKTGSGKTAAFGIALLARLDSNRLDLQSLVLCPTRELAEQVTREIRRLARAEENIKILTLAGGVMMRGQRSSLQHGAHIAVGTPGRMMDLLNHGHLSLEGLRTLVLDEADRMLDMGFYDDIAYLASRCPSSESGRQTLLFSATYPDGIAKLAAQFMHQPQRIIVATQHAVDKIHQRFYEIDDEDRLGSVARLLRHYRPLSTLAFCNTRQRCRELVERLQAEGFSALALHGELEQRDRDQVLAQFANRSCSVLVATDVAARGLDIEQLEVVINVDVSTEPEQHIHRIGRTGRGDAEGWALSLVSPREMAMLTRVEDEHRFRATWETWAQLTTRLPEQATLLRAPMRTIQLLVERKEKIRAGDVLGALTSAGGLQGNQIGKIVIAGFSIYVAVQRDVAEIAQRHLASGKIKGKTIRVRLLGGDGHT